MSSRQHTTSRDRVLEVGEKIERWRVVGPEFRMRLKDGQTRDAYPCECECGTRRNVLKSNLVKGLSRSCGCLSREAVSKQKRTHGQSKSRLYKVWVGMITRCENPKTRSYSDYGARGIRLCPEWRNDFASFHQWAMTNGYASGLTIERKDTDGNYSPDNCSWISRPEQSVNRRSRRLVTAFGETRIARDWVRDERCTVSFQTLLNRLKAGMDPETAITKPSRNSGGSKTRTRHTRIT